MTMFLEVNGTRYENFTNASAIIRLDTLSNGFSFGATSTEGGGLPFVEGDSCIVKIDDDTIITGFIETIGGDYDSESHSLKVSGRDKTGDIVDSFLDGLSDIRAPVTLKVIIEKVIENIGVSGVSVIENFKPSPFEKTTDVLTPEPGQNAFEYIEKLARQKQVLLTSDSEGNVVITRGEPTEFKSGRLQNILNAPDNNVKSAAFSYDSKGRFNKYKIFSQRNTLTSNFAGKTDPNALVSQVGTITDTEIRAGRQFVMASENPTTSDVNRVRAQWEANVRKTRGRTYNANVQDHRSSGEIWPVNKIIEVNDVFAGIASPMLINATTFNFSVGEGSTTLLEMVPRNSYELTLDEPATDVTGKGLTPQ